MVFSSTRTKKRSTRIEVSADSSSDDPGRRVVVDLISSGDDSGNNSSDDFEDHEASSETITHGLSLYLHIFTDQFSNASSSICCRKLLHMTLIGFGLKSTSSRKQLNRSRQVLKPVRAKQLSCNYNCYEACINIIFSFVLGTCCTLDDIDYI
jgi:hypothetical protein